MSLLSIGLMLLLSGCNLEVLDPKGSVGLSERALIATSTWAMLIIVIPVIALTLIFAWRYRATNKHAEYRPTWAHSTGIEVAVWLIPSLIVLFLAVLTWKSTHELDPYRPLDSTVKPINVEVVQPAHLDPGHGWGDDAGLGSLGDRHRRNSTGTGFSWR